MSEPALSPASNAPAEVSVSELSQRLKRTIEEAYGFVRVRGEISGFRGVHSSGHAYFALKDEGAKIDAVVWRSAWAKLRFKPEEGLEVVATGKLTTYPNKSAYQLVIETLEPAGAGALMALLEQRRKALAKEGLFDAARKKPLPYLPEVIGVITSPTGAVIRDILHRLADRFPRRVIVWPVRVQGETSAAEVAAAIAGFNALAPGGKIPRPDVLIVARGGGSLEDLWSFNEEIVVRAAAASKIPLIAAVGHETDTTLIDHAADRRAPTPTAAAEMAVPVRAELIEAVRSRGGRLDACARRGLERAKNELRGLSRALPGGEALLAMPRQRTDHAGARLQPALVAGLREARLRFSRVPLGPALLHARLVRAAGGIAALEARAERALRQASGRARSRLDRCAGRLEPALAADVRLHRSRYEKVAGRASPVRIAEAAHRYRARLGELEARLSQTATRALDRCRDELSRLEALIEALSYVNVLKRGFALVRDAADRPVRSSQGIRPGTPLDIEFADGRVKVNAEGAPRPRGRSAKPPPPGQGSLF